EVLRLGGLSVEQIESVVGRVLLRQASSDPGGKANQETAQLAPGMLHRHYAPGKPLIVVDSLEEVELQPTDALLLPQAVSTESKTTQTEILSETGDLTVCAVNFFAALRRLDAGSAARIVAVRFRDEGLGRALNDRLRRAGAKET
ncbi:MAG TPA: Sua5 family C-terminal domain-containing protein, partial [Planctomycetaceae bacterium]|nr:Sua5 family C-terminal domain-containing protein [Planctomycetaceae bacterium]